MTLAIGNTMCFYIRFEREVIDFVHTIQMHRASSSKLYMPIWVLLQGRLPNGHRLEFEEGLVCDLRWSLSKRCCAGCPTPGITLEDIVTWRYSPESHFLHCLLLGVSNLLLTYTSSKLLNPTPVLAHLLWPVSSVVETHPPLSPRLFFANPCPPAPRRQDISPAYSHAPSPKDQLGA